MSVFLMIDASISMSGEKMTACKKYMSDAIDKLDPSLSVTIIQFNLETTFLCRGCKDKAQLQGFIQGIPAGGGTAIETSLLEVFKAIDASDPHDYVLFVIITDAEDTVTYDPLNDALTKLKQKYNSIAFFLHYFVKVGTEDNECTKILERLFQNFYALSESEFQVDAINEKLNELVARVALRNKTNVAVTEAKTGMEQAKKKIDPVVKEVDQDLRAWDKAISEHKKASDIIDEKSRELSALTTATASGDLKGKELKKAEAKVTRIEKDVQEQEIVFQKTYEVCMQKAKRVDANVRTLENEIAALNGKFKGIGMTIDELYKGAVSPTAKVGPQNKERIKQILIQQKTIEMRKSKAGGSPALARNKIDTKTKHDEYLAEEDTNYRALLSEYMMAIQNEILAFEQKLSTFKKRLAQLAANNIDIGELRDQLKATKAEVERIKNVISEQLLIDDI